MGSWIGLDHWFPVDVSRIVEFLDLSLKPVVRFHRNVYILRSNSLVAFLFRL